MSGVTFPASRTAPPCPTPKPSNRSTSALQRRQLLPERALPRFRLRQRRTDHRIPLARYGVALITPALLDTSRQAKAAKQDSPPTTSPSTGRLNRPPARPRRPASPGTPSRGEGRAEDRGHLRRPRLHPLPPTENNAQPPRSNRRQTLLTPRNGWPGPPSSPLPSSRPSTGTPDYALRAGVESTIRQATARHRTPPRPLPRPGQDPPRPHPPAPPPSTSSESSPGGTATPSTEASHSHLARLQLSLAA